MMAAGGAKPQILLVGAMVAVYIAARVAIGILGRADGTAPGRRAVAQWLPAAVAAVAAQILGVPDIAVGIVFGTSVAALSLVLGMTTYLAPLEQLPGDRRAWPLVLPAAIVAIIAGFSGKVTLLHAILLLVLGASFLAVWLDRPAVEQTEPGDERAKWFGDISAFGWIALAAAIVVMGLAGWVGVYGATATAQHSRVVSTGLLAATILSPLLMLPALGESGILAQRGHCGSAVTGLVGTVLLNLCALLPLLVFVNLLMHGIAHWRGSDAAYTPLPFPLAVWRIDAVLLLMLAFALVPVAMGRWMPERLEAILLVVVYAAYLVAHTMLAARFF